MSAYWVRPGKLSDDLPSFNNKETGNLEQCIALILELFWEGDVCSVINLAKIYNQAIHFQVNLGRATVHDRKRIGGIRLVDLLTVVII